MSGIPRGAGRLIDGTALYQQAIGVIDELRAERDALRQLVADFADAESCVYCHEVGLINGEPCRFCARNPISLMNLKRRARELTPTK